MFYMRDRRACSVGNMQVLRLVPLSNQVVSLPLKTRRINVVHGTRNLLKLRFEKHKITTCLWKFRLDKGTMSNGTRISIACKLAMIIPVGLSPSVGSFQT